VLPEANADADVAVDEADSVEKVETEDDSADNVDPDVTLAVLPRDSVVADDIADTSIEELSNE